MTNAGIKAVLKAAMREDEKLSTAWMGFYLNVFLYAALVMNALALPSALSGIYNIPIWGGEGNVLELAMFFVNALTAVAAIMTFIELRDFTPAGYKWNIVLLVSGFAGQVLSRLSVWLRGEAGARMDSGFFIAAQVIAILVWLIPNLIYFRKRKHLFRAYTTAEVAAATKGEPPVAVVAAAVAATRKLCRYQPSKAKVDIRKLCSPQAGKATRYTRIIKAHKQMRAR